MIMDPEASLPAKPEARPSVYGRNFSYFSHRIFLVFMPEEMHKYLEERFELVASIVGESATDGDRLEAQLVRWVLLHRSQLNALALNRLLESWRGEDELLKIPPGLRSDSQYLMDITVQFALELELATAQNSPMMRNRPRLLMALIDAAYFLSRQRLEFDRHPGMGGEQVIDLSDNGLPIFRRYLVQRMNLEEDLREVPAESERFEPLSTEEIKWLQSVAAGIARTLTPASSKADLQNRWRRDVAPSWQKLGLSEPDQALFDALLVGERAPLQELPMDVIADRPTVAPPARLIGSLRFRWREAVFAQPVWSHSLEAIVAGSRRALRCVRAIDCIVRQAMFGGWQGSEADAASRPLRDLADRYRLLPTTPAWSSVERAIENLQQAAKGMGTIDAAYRDSLLLEEYAAMLCRAETAAAVFGALTAGAQLAGLRAEKQIRGAHGPATPWPASALQERPAHHDWEAALTALSEGLRCNEVDLRDVANRVNEYLRQMSLMAPVARPIVSEGSELASDTRRLSLQFWRPSISIRQLVRDAYQSGLADFKPMSVTAASTAGLEVVRRAGVLARHASSAPPAHASEIVCQVLEIGPALVLPLRLEQATVRQWTKAASLSLRDAMADRNRREDSLPVELAAHALERLGMRALHVSAHSALLASLGNAGIELEMYVRKHRLWTGAQSSTRVAVVVGPRNISMSDDWTLPPRDGLVLGCIDTEIESLEVLVGANWAGGLPDPTRLALEPMPKSSVTRIEQWARLRFGARYTLIWLARSTRPIELHPQLVDPKSADDLWEVGDLPPATAS